MRTGVEHLIQIQDEFYILASSSRLDDLPTALPPGFELAAVTQREDPRDVFLSQRYNNPQELPQRARVGTSSLRRQAHMAAST